MIVQISFLFCALKIFSQGDPILFYSRSIQIFCLPYKFTISCSISPPYQDTYQRSFTVLIHYWFRSLYLVLLDIYLAYSGRNIDQPYSIASSNNFQAREFWAFTNFGINFPDDSSLTIQSSKLHLHCPEASG